MKKSSARKIAALIVTLSLALSCLAGCTGEDTGETTETSESVSESVLPVIEYNEMRLAYVKSDSLDPFTSKSGINRRLLTLIYDGLFTSTNTYEPEPVIASTYSMDGTSLTVTLRNAVTFWDGSLITSDDVAYSFEQAKESDAYSHRLEVFDSVQRIDTYTVLFTLAHKDPYAAVCLDFPIVKYGTVHEPDKDEDSTVTVQLVPTGSGRYTVSFGAQVTLNANNSRLGSFWPQISSIKLVSVNDSQALFYSLEIGNISFAFDDLSGGTYTRASASTAEYQMNNMVYLGMNQENASLNESSVRRAIALTVDRTEILETAFQGHATAAYAPFNPVWHVSSKFDFVTESSTQQALATLEAAGYDEINSYNIRNNGSNSLTYKLIVNADNAFKVDTARIIASALAKIDIHVSVNALSPDDFMLAHKEKDYDLYIGEMNLTPNMSLSPFFSGKGDVASEIYSEKAGDAYDKFLSDKITVTEFVDEFNADMPFVPLCFRKGVVACKMSVSGATQANSVDIFTGIENWKFE